MNGINIFGKSVLDYRHMKKLKDHGYLDQHLKAMKAKSPNVFDAKPLRNFEDSQGFGYLTSNLTAINSEVQEVLYLDFRLPDLVPVQTNIPEGAVAYGYKVANKFGQGRYIENYGSDAKDAGVDLNIVTAPLGYAGIYAAWSVEDLRQAALAGFALDTETIEAATTGALKHMESVVLTGSTQKNIKGLVNQTGITIIPAGSTFSSSSDGQSVVTTINNAISALIQNSNEVFGRIIKTGLTVYLPVAQYNIVATLGYSVTKQQTVLNYLQKFNAWSSRTGTDIEFKSVIELAGAGAGGTDRMIISFNDPRVMEYGQAIAPRITTIVNEGFYYKGPMEYKFSGLNVKLPAGMLYVDGI